ncbi:MAG: glycosyl hydrolase family 65 protein [Limisphaera sp.]
MVRARSVHLRCGSRWLGLLAVAGGLWPGSAVWARASSLQVLQPDSFRPWIERFNALDDETVTNAIPNAEAWSWLESRIPFFECPDAEVVRTYYFRWWVFRKHLRRTPTGWVVTEFLPPVSHAGPYNTISCALGHHLAEGRWLRDFEILDGTLRFWLRGHQGGPQPHLHRYSQWLAAAVYERFLVEGDPSGALVWLEDLVEDHRRWEREQARPDGLFWQYDVRDGMEESLSGSRTERHARLPLNCYMYGNARALAALARLARREDLAREFEQRADRLQSLVLEMLWDEPAGFFKTLREDGQLADAREAIGFLPWRFGLVPPGRGYERAWQQLIDPAGFRAPAGLTTAERRHPRFRSHGVGRCEWDGAVWPFATVQTLDALARVLRHGASVPVPPRAWFDAFLTYTRSHQHRGRPWIGEYHDEVTGDWINRGRDRSKDYNHSTYADLLIAGVVGLVPQPDATVQVWPLLPDGAWDWFCLDGVPYHGRLLTVIWDRDGSRYGRGAGLQVWADGRRIGSVDGLRPLECSLP